VRERERERATHTDTHNTHTNNITFLTLCPPPPHPPSRQIPYVLTRIGTELGLTEAQLKYLIPTDRTLSNAAIDMQALSALMVGDMTSLAANRSFGFDASTKFGTHLQTMQVYVPGKCQGEIQTLHVGACQMAGENAEQGAASVAMLWDQVSFMGEAAGSDYNHVAGLTLLHFAGEEGGGEGVMTDHKEDSTVDAIEKNCHKYAMKNVPGYADRDPTEQRQWTFIARGYCIAHKCDNLCKNVIKGMDEFTKSRKWYKSHAKLLKYTTGKSFMWGVHKCIGMTGPMVTDLNLYKDFKIWLTDRKRTDDIKLLQALGPQVCPPPKVSARASERDIDVCKRERREGEREGGREGGREGRRVREKEQESPGGIEPPISTS
jgi:hypothetical protein